MLALLLLWVKAMRSLPLLGASPAPSARFRTAVLAKGFRPFFLLGALLAIGLVPLWALVLVGRAHVGAYLDPVSWHAHEMIFGFVGAIIAGFLLTAVENWTQRTTARGFGLGLLVALWIAGRVVLVANVSPRWLVAATDLAFLPALMIAIGRPIVLARNHRNIVMLVALLAMWLANLAMHLDALGVAVGWRRRGALVAVDVVTLLMVIIGGRVIPMFTRNATRDESVRSHPKLDQLALASIVLVLLLDAVVPSATIAKIAACSVAAVAVAVRSIHWGARRSARDPLLWILHVGHGWIPIGFGLRVLTMLDPRIPASVATHALTAGAMGALTLGMMARVALGHTGRALAAPRSLAMAFVFITSAAVLRVAVPLVAPGVYMTSLLVSAGLWGASFVLYVISYAPILTAPRVDGKPG